MLNFGGLLGKKPDMDDEAVALKKRRRDKNGDDDDGGRKRSSDMTMSKEESSKSKADVLEDGELPVTATNGSSSIRNPKSILKERKGSPPPKSASTSGGADGKRVKKKGGKSEKEDEDMVAWVLKSRALEAKRKEEERKKAEKTARLLAEQVSGHHTRTVSQQTVASDDYEIRSPRSHDRWDVDRILGTSLGFSRLFGNACDPSTSSQTP